ncbi:MAG: DinB family protein [Armatimonadota bacterium]|nr:DinB family protein [Armatimonadota bacterium]
MAVIKSEQLVATLANLLEEVHVAPPDPKLTWMTSNEPNSGFLGTLSGISAEMASRAPGMNTIAAHAAHLHFSLTLANRAFRGQDAYSNADRKESWRTQQVDAAAWNRLREALRYEHTQLLEAVRGRDRWDDPMLFQGALALIGHGAYHLGANRQIRRLLASAGSA